MPSSEDHSLTDRDSNESRVERAGLASSFACAGKGFAHAMRTQRNMRIHACFAVVAVGLGALFRIPVEEWLVIAVFVALVISLELVNTALEAVVDLASPHYHSLARIAKDCAAGAVLVSALIAFIVGVVLFAPRILAVIFG